ncbi:outer membrane protein assembly factor BamE [Qipengyuania sp. DSG2-2]|uniref:outer membrane protein assembly factor BamE n=1 Tax=Qipengyuania sp. DGS2-2 TaxID=3349631 RepID=UPI0036D40399
MKLRTGFKAQMMGTALVAMSIGVTGCSSITEGAGYIANDGLTATIQPGLDNRRSVTETLGRPSFTSQYGTPTWYYVSSTTGRKPFVKPRIEQHSVFAVEFDGAGNVVSVNTTGVDQVVYLSPDGDETPTLGRERSFLEDLFGNIGTVNAPGAPGSGGP